MNSDKDDKEYSRPATLKDLKTVIQSLNENRVPYLLIGGYALFAHGYHRTTEDIDILIPANKKTGEKLIKALLVLPDKAAKNLDLDWFRQGDTIRLADEIVIDIMFNACGETYESLQPFAEIIELDEIQIHTVNLEGLLKTKQTVRDKDAADRMVLQQAIELMSQKK